MTKETIQNYTLRISTANKSEIIVCVFELGEIYLDDAIECHKSSDMEGFSNNCTKSIKCINDLLESLNYDYELAFPLMEIYQFMIKELSIARIKYDVSTVMRIQSLLTKLKLSFEEVAKSDISAPVMQNSQSVYAGLTYGRNTLTESLDTDVNRGFTV